MIEAAKGKSTNWVVRQNFSEFLDKELASFQADFGFSKKVSKSSLREALMAVLGGPPKPVKSPKDNIIVLSACRHESCGEKGLFLADIKSKVSVAAIVHYVFEGQYDRNPQLFLASKSFNCSGYPDELKAEIKNWLRSESITPAKTRCLEGGKLIDLNI